PTSVLSMSARLGPSQSRAGSPEALRKGKIAIETGARAEDDDVTGPNSLWRKRKPIVVRINTAATTPMRGQGMSRPHGLTSEKRRVAAARLPCQFSRSAKA